MAQLKETQVKALKPKEKVYKMFDGEGLYLEVRPSGKKFWRLKYKVNKKDKTHTIGEYPFVTLKKAREESFKLKLALKNDNSINSIRTFEDIAKEFLKFKSNEWSENYLINQEAKLNNYIFDIVGNKIIKDVTKSDIIAILDNVVKKKVINSKTGDKIDLRKKIFLLVRQILRYSLHRDYLDINVCDKIDINEIIPKKEVKHIDAILDEKEFKNMVKALFELENVYKISLLSLKFLILTALRSGNVRKIKWSWVDFENKIITIPEEEMKISKEFRLPLTKTLSNILLEAKEMKRSQYIFYSPADKNKPLSESIFITMLKRAGISGHKPHGFRSSFSTLCYEHQKEHGFSSEIIETQLAHSVGNKVTRAYMRSDFLEERRELLQWWEEFLNG
jgi:integrase